ncbi:efflux RND transporter permease subunit [Sinorhizobium alkalisoli]|uniref:Cobalt-zinc-cadmium resistance protein CzcA n=1 Tax=Sinorhizobium alkalisoli TaxID=1752398 RepID=A0A1E3VI10_9HYPH|nr:efflux RND transporter permease subunit [Sinorhizobium alkalisoli]MCG5480233.1 efflux RND transporter permease subunit [Sinorhizobium alkalisoli]ODR93215.1 hypothetical protein A8M32_00880 [Sinorhizobium alkalisoli]
MLSKIIGLSLQFRYLVLLCAAFFVFSGISQLRSKSVDLLPEFGPLEVEVQTEALGLAAAEVEALITNPLEEILTGIPWLESMNSNSITGLSSVVLVFNPGTDMMNARQMVQERLLQASALPKVSKPPTMLQPVSSLNRTMQVGLSSGSQSLIELSILARWKIKPRLMSVPGVANVSIWGQRERQLQVQVDPGKLREKGVRLDDIIKAAGDALWVSPLTFLRASTPGNGGFIDTPSQRYDIRHVLPISSSEQLGRISFPVADGSTLLLSDVSTVVEGHQPMIGDGIVNDAPGILLMVEKLPGANTQRVTDGIEKALEALKPGLAGVEITSDVFRPATFIQTSIANLSRAVIAGGFLAILGFTLLLRNWRAAIIALVAIPLSLLVAWISFVLAGVTINALILAGLGAALAPVVDDAVADAGNIKRRLSEERDAEPATTKIFAAALEVRRPLLHATAIATLAILPFLFRDTAGGLLQPLFLAILVALLASMIVAQTVTPALSLLMSTGSQQAREPAFPGILGPYERLLSKAVASPWGAATAVGLLVLLGLLTLPFLHSSLLPAFKDRDLSVSWTMPHETSHPKMSQILREASKEVRSIAGVRSVGAIMGRAIQSDTVAGINSGELWVSITPDADYDDTLAAVMRALEKYPGIRSEPMSFATRRVRELTDERGEAVVVQIYGPAWDVLQNVAEEVRQALSDVPGVVTPQIRTREHEPSIEIEANLAAAERYGLKPGDVRRAAATLMGGIEVGSLYEGQKIFEVVVWGAPEMRRDPTQISEILIDSPSGQKARLGDVADVRLTSNPAVINRGGASRHVDVVAGIGDRDPSAVLADVGKTLQGIAFPLEYHPEVIGEDAEQQTAIVWHASFGIAAAVGIFLLLQASLGSWRLAALVYLLLPVSLTGSALAMLVGGGAVTIGSLAGLFAVLVITTRSAIVLVHRFQRIEEREHWPLWPDIILKVAGSHGAHVVTTATVTTLALLPLLIWGPAPGLEIIHPMAAAIAGGLVTSTIVVLFALPAFYSTLLFRPRPEAVIEPEVRAEGSIQHAAE